MLLLDDSDELPFSPTSGEAVLAVRLGDQGLAAIDARIVAVTQHQWLKVARIVHDALSAGGYDPWNDSHVHVHLRRVLVLVERGVLESQGDLRKPRWSEVRAP